MSSVARIAVKEAGATVDDIMTVRDAQNEVETLCRKAPKKCSITVTGPAAHGLEKMKEHLQKVRPDITSCFSVTPREGQIPVVADVATSITNVVMTKFTMRDGKVYERKFVVYIH